MQSDTRTKTAIIIGAGPGGLTAAYELIKRTPDIKPVIFEQSKMCGGISRTENYKGNLIDIGGHRFFSKSDRVLEWWSEILPIADTENELVISYHNGEKVVKKADSVLRDEDKVMLVRERSSRIFFLNNFFDYPISLNWTTIKNLGFLRMMKIGGSYLITKIRPIKPEINLEDFYINRFGRVLYKLFFMDYTKKVWGLSCKEMTAEWGRQRVKGLSLTKAFFDIFQRIFRIKSMRQKQTETSLIQRFLYPKFGPGQMWEEVSKKIIEGGGEIFFNCEAKSVLVDNGKAVSVKVFDKTKNDHLEVKGDIFFSTMPVRDLVVNMRGEIPLEVINVAEGLQYRDFITVGVLIRKIPGSNSDIKDNWIYVQDSSVHVGRIQIFNNWSPYLIKDKNLIWLGMEYFCNEGDHMWNMSDPDFKKMAVTEIAKIGFSKEEDVIDSTIIRQPKAYPGYFGTYDKINIVKNFLNKIENLFLVGRNGMHKYNNQDHSMLTAMMAVDNIVSGIKSKDNIWAVNTEEEYHETK